MRLKRTRHRAGFPEAVLQHLSDDSWRSDGQRPELFDPAERESFGAKLHSVSGYPEQALEASK